MADDITGVRITSSGGQVGTTTVYIELEDGDETSTPYIFCRGELSFTIGQPISPEEVLSALSLSGKLSDYLGMTLTCWDGLKTGKAGIPSSGEIVIHMKTN